MSGNPPRPFNLDDPAERRRLLGEVVGYLAVSRNDGTDRAGRAFALEALEKVVAQDWRLAPPKPPEDPRPSAWFWWQGATPETCHGPHATREAAREEALCGEPGDTFTTGLARPERLAFDFLRADRVLEDFEEHNADKWGEDEPISATTAAAQECQLEAMLAEAFHTWCRLHGLYPRAWCLEEFREERTETIPGAAGTEIAEGSP
jgi:hypothetical protein